MNFKNDKVGDTLPIRDGTEYRAYCYEVTKHFSRWILQCFKKSKFLWWSWSDWEVLTFEYGAIIGPSILHYEAKRKEETNEELIWEFEYELNFLGLDY